MVPYVALLLKPYPSTRFYSFFQRVWISAFCSKFLLLKKGTYLYEKEGKKKSLKIIQLTIMFRNHDMELQVETLNLLWKLPNYVYASHWCHRLPHLNHPNGLFTRNLNLQHKFCIMCMGCHHHKIYCFFALLSN